jgi:tRNA1(Val) A37 N6-methylase TrmN6
MSFRPVSHSLHTKLTKEVRQAEGIFFTPAAIRARLFELLAAAGVSTGVTRVLEPSFGSGEFVFDLLERFPAAKIHGVELNRTAFLETAAVVSGLGSEIAGRLVLTNTDFLKYTGSAGTTDLIVGNPPYFVTKQKDARCMTGRGNVFVQFIYKCLTEHLVEGGVLAFVLPTSFYNCCYYDPCRRYIAANTTILAVEEVEAADFYDTAQKTMLFVLRRSPSPASAPAEIPFILTAAGSTYINPHAAALAAARAEAGATIAGLGCAVKTGEVVWNQHKEKLTADPSGSNTVLVLYSNNIKGGTLQVGDPGKGKQQYIRNFEHAAGPTTGPAILVSRGYGNTTYSLNFVMVPAGMRFYGENHVNVITGPAAGIERIAASLADARSTEFIQQFVGNGALSKTELESVLPIW